MQKEKRRMGNAITFRLGEMEGKLREFSERSGMSLSEIVRYCLAGGLKYLADSHERFLREETTQDTQGVEC
jgi:hypothetical protein